MPGNHTDAMPVQFAGRSYYEELLDAGVRIFEYLPSMMHAKTVVVDDAWGVIGSANMDERSMELNEENIVGIADRPFARAVAEGLERDFARSREVSWRSGGGGRCGSGGLSVGEGADRAVLSGPASGRPHPPAIAATTVISSPDSPASRSRS